jgi:biotin carboxyl carrier protein
MKYTVNIDQKTYIVEIESLSSTPIIAVVGGIRFEVWPESGNPTQSANAALSQTSLPAGSPRTPATGSVPSGTSINLKAVRAPIPGVIVDVSVKQGDQVDFGQTLFMIEAMKMRNAIRASRPGVIGEVLVSVGQTVNHNDLLLEFVE